MFHEGFGEDSPGAGMQLLLARVEREEVTA
jgi:hypothetical protein